MADEPEVKKGGISIPMNGWTVAIVCLFLMVGFVIFGSEHQHELFLAGIERIVGALESLLK